MSPGLSVAHYRITVKLGQGGMGEVWRATDTKLNREVAIKVLPEAFAQDADRMARFAREAQVLACLNHPNIASIYGVDDRALVMELVEGTNLSGPLSLNEALPLIHQFIDALEYAHEKGIVHRDLKPDNIMVTSEGRLKLLDFGLAKALSDQNSWNAETTLTMQQTCVGAIVGTPAYMSPEQLRGKPVDKRTDIWALGAVVYELLTGRRAADENPDWTALPKNLTPGLQRLLQLCLEPDVRRRLRDIGDARVILDGIPNQPPPLKKRQWLHWAVATALLVGILAAIGFYQSRPNDAAGVRFTIPYPEEPPSADRDRFTNQVQAAPAPDGRTITFVASGKSGAAQLWIRKLNSFSSEPLSSTEGARLPFWSPDGQFIGFFANGKLMKIALNGGPVQTICEVDGFGEGAAWARNDMIVFSSGQGPLMRVRSGGGMPTGMTQLDKSAGERDHVSPQFLPDGHHFLYLARTAVYGRNTIYVQELGSHTRVPILTNTNRGVFAVPGHLLFTREGTLFAQPLDLKSLSLQGQPSVIANDVSENPSLGESSVAVSNTGMLIYRSARPTLQGQLVWHDRSGKQLRTIGDPAGYRQVSLSPDEKLIAITGFASTQAKAAPSEQMRDSSLWIIDSETGAASRITFGEHESAVFPIWSPDSKRIVVSRTQGLTEVVVATGATRILSRDPRVAYPYDWSPDGRYVVCNGGGGRKPMLFAMDGGNAQPFIDNPYANRGFRFSPDGKRVVYFSDESGRFEVYVAAFPSLVPKRQISRDGGSSPSWSRDGKEVFFLAPDLTLMAAQITGIKVGTPQPLFKMKVDLSAGLQQFEPANHGDAFLAIDRPPGRPTDVLNVMMNWQSDLHSSR